ncbi:MAG: linear amide C-N hydrolase, partial [Proteobacteria bacterium]|nr:linear amide C-N hydrolase [Pseudomonadota bacterium]
YPQAQACTILSAPKFSQHWVGKSYDWDQEQGLLVVNKRHMQKTALLLDQTSRPLTWTSQFGSVTFNQFGREFPNGGMNEAGLVVEIAWLDDAAYNKPDDRAALNELQWIQYQLDRFATTQAVTAHLASIRIEPAYAKVHYLVCDATTSCVTVEYLHGQLVAHSGRELDVQVLTNGIYADYRQELSKYQGFGGSMALPTGSSSFARFARAASFATQPQPSSTGGRGELFKALAAVSQGDYSKWKIVYGTGDRSVSWATLSGDSVKSLSLNAFDFSCHSPVQIFPVVSSARGDVTAQFVPYSTEANLALVSTTLKDLADSLPPGIMQAVADYPDETVCTEP